nr:pyridoxal-phosphate dependent enzyme [Candidatus Krumholzibacteriota bacterium]
LPQAAAKMEEEIIGGDMIRLSTFREPCRVEGKKTIAFEIENQCGAGSPDWILFPTGGGTGVVAIWKAYRELQQLGWLNGSPPRIGVIQAEGCAPVVRAFAAGTDTIDSWKEPETVAAGIRVPSSRADRQIMQALYETAGTAVAVSDAEILQAVFEMSSREGVFPSPEGASTWAGLKSLIRLGTIDPAASIVIVNTAGWSRYRFLLDTVPAV